MALARYEGTAVDVAGNVIPNATVEVRQDRAGRPVVPLFADRDGAVAIGNPITANEKGQFGFHARGGTYYIRVFTGPTQQPIQEYTRRYQAIGTAAERDVEDLASALNAGLAIFATNADLQVFDPPENANVGARVINDPDPSNNGDYILIGEEWVKQRGLPDTLGRLEITGGTADAIEAELSAGVDPANVVVLFIEPEATNTGAVSLNSKPVRTLNDAPLLQGDWAAGRTYWLTDEGDHFRVRDDGDILARRWAELGEDVPVLPGRFSSMHWSSKSALSAENAEEAKNIAAGYASDAVSQGNVPIYATFAGMPAISIPDGINSIMVKGGVAAGDMPAASFKTVGANPNHPGAFQSADGRWWEIVERRIHPELFGTNFDVALLKALEAAHAVGATVVFRPNKTYLLSSGVAAVDLNVRIEGNHARLLRAAAGATDFYGLRFSASFSLINDVVAIAKADFDFGTTGTNSKVTRIEMASIGVAATYAVGDTIKVFADDLIPSSPADDKERIGESARIAAISGAYIYLYRILVENYATNVRIARFNPISVDVRDFTMGDEAGSPTGRRLALMNMQGLVEPQLRNIRFSDGLTVGLERESCHEPRSWGLQGRKLRTVPPVPGSDPGTFAYLIGAYSETGGEDVDAYGEKLRHVYTTGTKSTDPDDTRVERYGGVVNGVVSNAIAVDCEHAAFDTHPDAYGVIFRNCRMIGGHRGPIGSYYSHQLRGRKCRITGGDSTSPCSVNIDMIGNDGDHYVEVNHRRPTGVATTAAMIRARCTGASRGKLTLKMGMEASDGTAPLVELTNVELKSASEFAIDWAYDSTGPAIFELTITQFRGRVLADLSRVDPSITTSPTIFHFADGNNDVAPEMVTVIANNNGRTVYMADFNSFAGRAVFPLVEFEVGVLNGTNGGFLTPGAGAIYWANDRSSAGTRQGRSVFSIPVFTVAGAQAASFTPRGAPNLVGRIGASVSGVIIDALPKGTVDGQMLTLVNNNGSPSAQSITVKYNASGFIAIGAGSSATVVIAPYGAVTFVWQATGNLWRPVGSFPG